MPHSSPQICELIIHLESVIALAVNLLFISWKFQVGFFVHTGKVISRSSSGVPGKNHSNNFPRSSFITVSNIP